MKLSIDGKVVVVTGASRGIGAAIAEALGHHGATVIINYLNNREKAAAVLARVKKNGGNGIIFQADVRDADAVNAMVETAINTFGRIDVLVNNANIDFPIKPFIALTWEEINGKITGEMQALYNCSQAVLRDMTQRKSGKLIFISSSLSRHPAYGFAAHAAAKSAVDSMARVMATELGPEGITVNVIGPGLVKTDATAGQPPEMHEQIAAFTPLRRVGMPDDVAGVTVFLASSLSDYLTGQYIPVTGGSFMI
ncbi:MAG: SDR family oxidoreductase [Proteobacteria bacterium]|nr:SDR family oxidoreductase [Pseudomonadota bacterium]MBU1710890.1 SDR family oxidoreductase [Pseudomonadota bacterium]